MIQDIYCFTRNYRELRSKLLTKCFVSAAWLPQEDTDAPPMLEFDALWDTGATASVISKDVATKLDLLPEGTSMVFHAQGSERVPIYFVNLGLPSGVESAVVRVTQGVLTGCDVLIGMDIINKGDFAVTNRGGVMMLSFQMPSIDHIDFVEMLEEKNEKAFDIDSLKKQYFRRRATESEPLGG